MYFIRVFFGISFLSEVSLEMILNNFLSFFQYSNG